MITCRVADNCLMRRHSKYGVVQDARWCRLSAKRHTCPPARCASAGTGLRRLAVLPPAASQQPKSLCTFHTLIINHSCRVPSTRHADSEAWRRSCHAVPAPPAWRRPVSRRPSAIAGPVVRNRAFGGQPLDRTALEARRQAAQRSGFSKRVQQAAAMRAPARGGRGGGFGGRGGAWGRCGRALHVPRALHRCGPALPRCLQQTRATHMATGCGSSLPGAACGAPTAPTLALPFLGLQAVAAEALVAVEVAGASTVSPRALPSVSGWPVAAAGGGGVQAASLESSLLLKVTLCHCLRLTAAHVVLSAVQRWWRRASMCTPARARWCASSQTPW